MTITNNTLMVLVVGVLALSVLGTTFSLKMLGQHEELPTGYAASDTGTVDLLITQSASLTLDNNDVINFGTCTVDSINAFSYYNSTTDGSGANNNSLCDGVGNLPDELIIRNDGTIQIAVTMNASTNGSDMFNSPGSAIYYNVTSPSNGCNGTMVSWSEITSLEDLPVCTWLRTYSQNSNTPSTVEFDFAADVALGGYNMGTQLTLTFEATAT